jgi:hypothetical protein
VLAVLALPCWDSLWVVAVAEGTETKDLAVVAQVDWVAQVAVATVMV